MAADDTPNSYKDPFWTDLASGAEQKIGLPKGLLVAVLTRGERSNNNQVSDAGARTPFQIIPSTRKAAIDKWGIDPYLSPQNAAEVSARLLKDSMDRNGGSVPTAVAEYIGGTDRDNWGPNTRSYVKRVVGAEPSAVRETPPAVTLTLPPSDGLSTFDRVSAAMGVSKPTTSQIANVFQAYKAGQMPEADAKQFEEDVNAGRIMLPRGASLNGSAATSKQGVQQVPDGVLSAFARGDMTPQEMADFESDVRSGAWKLPADVDATALFGEPEKPKSVMERIGELPGRIGEAVTGAERRTAQTDSLPDWGGMPELNTASGASLKAGIGTMFAGTPESVQIIKANFPGVKVDQDEKGNYLLTSSIDGKQYAIKPGFQWSDVPRAVGALAAFTPAGRATSLGGMALGAGATQAAIETSQATTGGEFNPGEVATAAALAPVLPAVVNAVKAVAPTMRSGVGRVLGRAEQVAGEAPATAVPPPTGAAPETAAAPPAAVGAVVPVAPAVAAAQPAATMSATDLAQTARSAAEGGMGSGKAMRTLADQAAPDAKTIESAQRLGIEEYLQPDHVTTNQAYRELSQAVKSFPGSVTRQAELEGLEQVGKRADELISEVGGTTDVSMLDAGVKSRLQAQAARMQGQANDLWGKLRNEIPNSTTVDTPATTAALRQTINEMGGEAQAMKVLPPAAKKMLGPMMDGEAVTHGYLDNARKQIGQAMQKGTGPFADMEQGQLKRLYATLSQDQEAVARSMGDKAFYTFQAAKYATTLQKGFEDDLKSLFGKQVDGSLIGDLNNSMAALPKGDVSKLTNLLSAVPQDMRQSVVASGLNSAFGKTARNGALNFNSFANWYEGLLRNKQAYAAVMSNLPQQARKQLSDLYRVSNGIRKATRERITTGRIQAVQQELQGADSLMSNLYGLAKRAAVGVPAEAVTSAMGLPGAGLASGLASALAKGKPSPLKAADALISSPEFVQAARAAGKPQQAAAAKALANSKPFMKFVRAVGAPREISNRERWIANAMQAQNNLNGVKQ